MESGLPPSIVYHLGHAHLHQGRSMIFRQHWPKARAFRGEVPGDIKRISVSALSQLQDAAERANSVSATGRPQWVAEHVALIDHVLVAAISIERPGWHRCVVLPFGVDEPLGQFSLGVSFDDFARMPEIPWTEAAKLLREMLLRTEPIPLDPEQHSSWQDEQNSY
jgi:hypothetical protein